MNIKELHAQDKTVSAASLFKSDLGNATALQILQGEKLKEHITKTPACLICMEGKVVFENEQGVKAVSYTHLDVYKRQNIGCGLDLF